MAIYTFFVLATDAELRSACQGWLPPIVHIPPVKRTVMNPFTKEGKSMDLHWEAPPHAFAPGTVDHAGISKRFEFVDLDWKSPFAENFIEQLTEIVLGGRAPERGEVSRPVLVGPGPNSELVHKVPERLVDALANADEGLFGRIVVGCAPAGYSEIEHTLRAFIDLASKAHHQKKNIYAVVDMGNEVGANPSASRWRDRFTALQRNDPRLAAPLSDSEGKKSPHPMTTNFFLAPRPPAKRWKPDPLGRLDEAATKLLAKHGELIEEFHWWDHFTVRFLPFLMKAVVGTAASEVRTFEQLLREDWFFQVPEDLANGLAALSMDSFDRLLVECSAAGFAGVEPALLLFVDLMHRAVRDGKIVYAHQWARGIAGARYYGAR